MTMRNISFPQIVAALLFFSVPAFAHTGDDMQDSPGGSTESIENQKLTKQYDAQAKQFSDLAETSNKDSNSAFFNTIDFSPVGKKILDMGCGDGLDLAKLISAGGIGFAFDSSEEMVKIAKLNNPGANIQVGSFENIPFPDQTFDVVVSKWAFQTYPEIEPIYAEIVRVLKPGGRLVILVGHPIRQFI